MSVRSKTNEADARFAEGFKSARVARGLTQEEVTAQMVARGFGFYQATVYKVENNMRRVTIAEALALAEIVGRPVEVLVLSEESDAETSRAAAIALAREWLQSMIKMSSYGHMADQIGTEIQNLVTAAEDDGDPLALKITFEPILSNSLGISYAVEIERALESLPAWLLETIHVKLSDLPESPWSQQQSSSDRDLDGHDDGERQRAGRESHVQRDFAKLEDFVQDREPARDFSPGMDYVDFDGVPPDGDESTPSN